MTDLISVNYDNEQPTVSGRELHEALQIKTAYKDWFPRMCEYGFEEGKDFNPLIFEQVRLEGNREVSRQIVDHNLTIPMAKELCMIQRTDLGRKFRQYFISVEEAWNSPEVIMRRALQYANANFERIMQENRLLVEDNALKTQQISEMKPKASYCDMVLASKDLVPITLIAKDYGWTAQALNKFLADKGIQFKQGDTWLLYQDYAQKGYTQSKTFAFGSELEHAKMHTYWTQRGRLFIYDLMKEDGILPIVEQTKKDEGEAESS